MRYLLSILHLRLQLNKNYFKAYIKISFNYRYIYKNKSSNLTIKKYDSKNNRQCVLLLINIWKQIISYNLNGYVSCLLSIVIFYLVDTMRNHMVRI